MSADTFQHTEAGFTVADATEEKKTGDASKPAIDLPAANTYEEFMYYLCMIYGVSKLDPHTSDWLKPFRLYDRPAGTPTPNDTLVVIGISNTPLSISRKHINADVSFVVSPQTLDEKDNNIRTIRAVIEMAVLAAANPAMVSDGVKLTGSPEMQVLLYMAAQKAGLKVAPPENIPDDVFKAVAGQWQAYTQAPASPAATTATAATPPKSAAPAPAAPAVA